MLIIMLRHESIGNFSPNFIYIIILLFLIDGGYWDPIFH